MRRYLVLALLSICSGCGEKKADPKPKEVMGEIAEAPPAPLGSHDEASLRTLLRDPSEEATDQFKRLLYGSPEARRVAPLALGLRCSRDTAEGILPHLVAAAAAWASEKQALDSGAWRGLGWAIGACGTDEGEDLLRHWLSPSGQALPADLVEAAIFGLGAHADRRGSLNERTQTSILDVAARLERPDFLLPLGRAGRLSEAVGAHILEVSGKLLTVEKKGSRRHTIFALGSAGPSAAAPLGQVLLAESYSPEERAAAAQALGRLGGPGQKVLDETLDAMLERGLPTEFDRPLWVPLRATMETLEESSASKKRLGEIGAVVLPEAKEPKKAAQRRRLIWLKCQAAALLSRGRPEFPALLTCDPDKGRDFHLSQLDVLDTERIDKKRLALFKEKLSSEDPVIAQAALRLIASHPEIEDAAKLLLGALASKAAGTQAVAAQVIAAYPSRVRGTEEDDDQGEAVVAQLAKLLEAPEDAVPAETRAAAIKAGAALSALSLKPLIEKYCKGTTEAFWESAEQALRLLGDIQTRCPSGKREILPSAAPPEPVTLIVQSDVGRLLLHVEGRDAPLSARHFLDAVSGGTYSKMAVHATRAGFAVQFGDPDGDGYQSEPAKPLPHEVSPEPFTALTFGMSSFSPGSHDHQIFVVVSDAPQLFGSRVRLGRAEGPWHLLAVGDQIHSIEVKR